MIRKHFSIGSFAVGVLLCCALPVSAQLGSTVTIPTVTTNFHFNVPFALTVAHPCRAGFVLIKGNTALDLTTLKATDFRLALTAAATGTGEDATETGAQLATGFAPYDYASGSELRARFPDGTPVIFAHSLTVIGELIRSEEDAFTVRMILDIEYNDGIPTTPKLRSIDISCN